MATATPPQVFRLPMGQGTGVFRWRISGPTVVKPQPVCPPFPAYFSFVLEASCNTDRMEQRRVAFGCLGAWHEVPCLSA
jgi:hypothetical protein